MQKKKNIIKYLFVIRQLILFYFSISALRKDKQILYFLSLGSQVINNANTRGRPDTTITFPADFLHFNTLATILFSVYSRGGI